VIIQEEKYMLIDTLDAVKKLRAANIPEEQAEAITSIIANIDDTVATKADIKMLETKIDTDIKMLETKIDIQTSWLIRSAFVIIGLLIKIAFF
jgi:hypothetical protein